MADQFTFPDPAAGFIDNRRNFIANSVRDFNTALYASYARAIDNANRNIDTGRVDPATLNIPVPNGLAATPDGLNTMDGGPVGPVIPYHEDHSKTQAQIAAALPPGVIDIGHVDGGAGSGIFVCGPKDSWPAGVMTPPDVNGHVYLKFSWAGFGYKYMQVK